jgi:hypothetical protein
LGQGPTILTGSAVTHNYPDGFNNETDYTLCLGFFEAFFHKHILQCCPEFRHTWPIPSAPPALSTDATLDATTDAVALSTAPVALRITAAGDLEEKMVACTRPLWASPSRCVCVCVFVVALVLTILLVVVISYLRGLLSRRGACVHARQLFTALTRKTLSSSGSMDEFPVEPEKNSFLARQHIYTSEHV